MAVMPIFVGLGGIGPCPICGSTIEANDRSQKNLLCKGCTSYIDAEDKKLRKSPADRITQVPVFAAPTPWSDLRLVLSPTIALSTQDYVANLLMSKKGNVRMLSAQWPQACCVCGKTPSKTEKYARTIMVPPQGSGCVIPRRWLPLKMCHIATLTRAASNLTPYIFQTLKTMPYLRSSFDRWRIAMNSCGSMDGLGVLRHHRPADTYLTLDHVGSRCNLDCQSSCANI